MSDTSTTRSGQRDGIATSWLSHGKPRESVTGLSAMFWGMALVAAILDVIFTYYGLKAGFVELNPIVRWAITVFGGAALPVLKAAAILLAVVGWLVVNRVYRPLVPLILGVPWCIAALVNGAMILAHL